MNPDVQDALMTFFGTVITGVVSIAAAYAKQHWNIQNDATRNAAIASYASRLAPFVVKELMTAGTDVMAATTNHPVVKAFADTLVTGYPDFAKGIGMTPASAANFVLSEAIKYSQLKDLTVAGGVVSDASPAPAPVPAPAAKLDSPPSVKRNDALGIPPPQHLENYEDVK